MSVSKSTLENSNSNKKLDLKLKRTGSTPYETCPVSVYRIAILLDGHLHFIVKIFCLLVDRKIKILMFSENTQDNYYRNFLSENFLQE